MSQIIFMRKNILFVLFAAVILLTGCSDDDNPYSGYRANFIFNGTEHPYNQARTPGQYICVKHGANIGLYKLTDARGNTTTVQIPEIYLQQSTFHYGLGGLIIGTPSAYGDGNLMAFDWACPSCQVQKHRVKIDYVMGHATCPKCSAKFDLNSGGIAIEGKSDPLMRYRVIDNGSTVIVQN